MPGELVRPAQDSAAGCLDREGRHYCGWYGGCDMVVLCCCGLEERVGGKRNAFQVQILSAWHRLGTGMAFFLVLGTQPYGNQGPAREKGLSNA